jgi:hypothetical protein
MINSESRHVPSALASTGHSMAPIARKRLGSSELEVPIACLGTMTWVRAWRHDERSTFRPD